MSLINNSRNTPKREQKVANRNNKGQIREGNQLGTKVGENVLYYRKFYPESKIGLVRNTPG